MSNKLTIRREGFAKDYVEGGNASEAYRNNFSAENMSDNAVHVEASKLLKDPKVSLRIEELQKELQNRHEVTVDTLTKELEEARAVALVEAQPSAMVSASLGKAKLHGLLVEKKEHTGKDGGPIETVDHTPEQVAKEVDALFTDPSVKPG